MSFLAKVEAHYETREPRLEFRQAVLAKYKVWEKIKSVTKSALKKVTLGLIGVGLFSSALMADPNKVKDVAQKYQHSIQQMVQGEGSDLVVTAQAKKLGDKQFVLKIKIMNKESKDYAIIEIIKSGGTFQDIELRTNPGPDRELDPDVEMWGHEVYNSWAESIKN